MKWVSVILVNVSCLGDGKKTATDEATDKSIILSAGPADKSAAANVSWDPD